MSAAAVTPIAYNAKQAAAAIGISVDRMTELANKGECPAARRIGNRWVFSVAQLREWIDDGPVVLATQSTRKKAAS